ncbi:MAG: DUF3021 domain-containing protein [Clostridia bacterium]|nr:DUF3021 domain-containing protein [Clostridia bacterium]
MLKKTLKRAGIGFLIGVAIGYGICILEGTADPDSILPVSDRLLHLAGSVQAALVLQGLFSGLYGAACFAGMSLYELERLPLAAATALHCAMIILLFIPIALLLGWVSGAPELLIIAGMQLVAFFLIWLIMWAIYKKQVKELNEMQEQFQQR